jgi:hypothetical protein
VSPNQLVTNVLVVLVAATIGSVIVFQRGRARRWAFVLLFACAITSAAAWTNFGRFQDVSMDADAKDSGPGRKKVHAHLPFHFHEFVHYYVGAKYFRELGYLGLYDCIALADREIADEDRHPPRVSGWVRDLGDVLTDKTFEQSLADCRTEQRPRFTDARWASFKGDVRELARLVDDGAWPGVIFDAGFNPPPSLIVVSSAFTNLVPIRSGSTPTFLIATGFDLVLLVACFVVLARSFGLTMASTALLFFGATFVSHYSWNGGSVMRFTWLASIVFALAALKGRRWALAGALFGAATCDRIFPAAFAVFAMIPIAVRARRSLAERATLKRFAVGYGASIALFVVASVLLFGASSWRTFFERVGRHGDVYYVMHIGLKKVLTFRDWVPSQNFHGHEGLVRFREWNLHLRETWRAMWPIAVPVQLLLAGGAAWAAARRRPHEAALLGGVVFMFAFNLPANYYYCVLTLIPAVLLFGAATTPSASRRWRDFVAYAGFAVFWTFTFLAPFMSGDGIVYNHYLSTALLAFLVLWLAAWSDVDPRALIGRLRASSSPSPAPPPPEART